MNEWAAEIEAWNVEIEHARRAYDGPSAYVRGYFWPLSEVRRIHDAAIVAGRAAVDRYRLTHRGAA